jgi:hypothetical protein
MNRAARKVLRNEDGKLLVSVLDVKALVRIQGEDYVERTLLAGIQAAFGYRCDVDVLPYTRGVPSRNVRLYPIVGAQMVKILSGGIVVIVQNGLTDLFILLRDDRSHPFYVVRQFSVRIVTA